MSRYSVLIDDVRSGMTRFDPFLRRGCASSNSTASAHQPKMAQLSPREQADAVARMAENALHRAMGRSRPWNAASRLTAGRWSDWYPGAGRDCRRCRLPDQGTRPGLRQSARHPMANGRAVTVGEGLRSA